MKHTTLLTPVFGFVVGLLLCLPASNADAKIKRTCKGTYEVRVFSPATPTNPYGDHLDTRAWGWFGATAGCGNLVPDRCRRRARDRQLNCMEDHFDNWYNVTFPYAGMSRPNKCNNVNNYNVPDLSQVIYNITSSARASSSKWRGKHGKFKVQVIAGSFQTVYPWKTGSACNGGRMLGTRWIDF